MKPVTLVDIRCSFVFAAIPFVVALAVLAVPAVSVAQEPVAEDDPLAEVLAGHSAHGSAFNDGARQAARILGGTGNVNFEVTTESDEARNFFNQGVGQLHGFWDLEAERSFRQTAMIDPDCAMAYWGAALATFEKPERAAGFIQEAFDRIENASEREKQYIRALHRYFRGEPKKAESKNDKSKSDKDGSTPSGGGCVEKEEIKYELVDDKNRKKRAARYLRDLEDIVLAYPDDIEAKALVVHRIWHNGRAGWPIGSYVAAEALLKEIFAVNPMHPAHHYRIHVWDRRNPEAAVESAGMCGLSAPSIAHMWHMPGHIFSRLHRYDEAVFYQEASARTDHRHMITDHVIPDEIHNYAHNNEWLTRNYVFLGRAQDALRLAINLVELPRHPKYNTTGIDRSGSVVYGQKRLVQVLREFQLRDQLAEVVQRGCFTELDADQTVAALRLQGCFAALDGTDESENTFQAELKELLGSTEETRDAAKKLVEDLKAQLEEGNKAKKKDKGDTSEKADQEKPKKVDLKALGKEYKEAKKESEKVVKRFEAIENALKAIEGYQAVAKSEIVEAAELLKKAKGEDESWLAELKFLGGEKDDAMKLLREQVKKRTNQSIPLARLAWCLAENGDEEEAKETFAKLRNVAIGADQSVEVFSRLSELAKLSGYDSQWVIEKSVPTSEAHFRPSLDSLGPVHWSPPKAPEWAVVDSDNLPASSDSFAGENYLMIFYLGHGCLHCAEQLEAFGPRVKDFEDAGIKMIAISSDDQSGLAKSLENYEGEMPMRLASDVNMEIFKAFRARDDFENQPLHGTFLIDAKGKVRWQDISYEPFMDHEFLLQESKRLLKF